MRHLLTLSFAGTLLTMLAFCATSCGGDDDWEKYEDYRIANEKWYAEMAAKTDVDGQPYFTSLNPTFDPSAQVLIHYYNDRSLTAGNLSPLQTSTVAVKYRLSLSTGVAVDSSYALTDSLLVGSVGGFISGWQVALNAMRVGDSARVIVPYPQGYGGSSTTSVPAYSTLDFDMKLVDIPAYNMRDPK